MNAADLSPGDYVEHCNSPGTIWQARDIEPYTPDGGHADLKWVGGTKITYELRGRICNVYDNGTTAFIRDLRPANPMMVLALESR